MKNQDFLRFVPNDQEGVFEKFSRQIFSVLEQRFENSRTFVDIEIIEPEKHHLRPEEVFSLRSEIVAVLFCLNGKTRMGVELQIGDAMVRVICNNRHHNDSLVIITRVRTVLPAVWQNYFKPRLYSQKIAS